MICALMIGRAGSVGFPSKNTKKILDRRLCGYPLMAAQKAKNIDKIFVSTDCPIIEKTATEYGASIIRRPKELCTSSALGEDVFKHGYYEIKKRLKPENSKIELLVLLMANAPMITSELIEKGIKLLRKDNTFDSAVTTSIYNMWSPLRARKLDKEGALKPFVPFESFGDPKNLNCDRDSQGDVYFADMSVSIVRPKCLENLQDGLLPQKWMGQKIAPIKSDLVLEVDYEWQIPAVEYWLKKNDYEK